MIVLRYPLSNPKWYGYGDTFELDLPLNARVLTFQVQGWTPTIWVACEAAHPTKTRTFAILATGQSTDEYEQYIGTIQLNGLVWHLFEVR